MNELAQDAASGADLSISALTEQSTSRPCLRVRLLHRVRQRCRRRMQSATAIVDVTCKSFNAANDRANEISDEFAASDEITGMSMDD
ncbi:MAG: hypothetical protein ACLTQI_05500 [Slackia sp.]